MQTARLQPSLRESMTAYLDGDQQAFVHLHRRLTPVLRQRISKLISDPGTLEDVVQSAFLRAHEGRDRFTMDGATDTSIVAWYVAIARNTALDHVRRSTRRQRREQKAVRFDKHRWGGGTGHEANPEMRRMLVEHQTETTLRVRAALDDLNAADRTLVVDHKVHGKALAELARDRGVPAVTMRVRAHRAYRRLIRAMQQHELYDRGRCDALPPSASWSLRPQPSR